MENPVDTARRLLDVANEQVSVAADSYATYEMLHADVQQLLTITKNAGQAGDEPRFWLLARSSIRAQFAFFEFATRMFLQLSLFFEVKASKLSKKNRELANLFLADDKGGRMGMLDAFKFSIRCVETTHELVPATDFGTSGWKDFQDTTVRRDGFMHPKKSADVLITPEEFNAMISGTGWAIGAVNLTLQKMADSYESKATEPNFDKVSDRLRNIGDMIEQVSKRTQTPEQFLGWLHRTRHQKL